jgi:hypothetical protein
MEAVKSWSAAARDSPAYGARNAQPESTDAGFGER